MKPRFSLLLSIGLAAGALFGGYRMSRKPSGPPVVWATIPFEKISSASFQEYHWARGKTSEDYLTLLVKGCPPKAPADLLDRVETVVDFRNCTGKALIAK